MRRRCSILILLMGACCLPSAAQAYVGPGADITMLSFLWATVAAFGTAILGFLLWPIRALWRRLRRGKTRPEEPPAPNETAAPPDA